MKDIKLNKQIQDWDKIKDRIFNNVKCYKGELLYKYRSLDLYREWVSHKEYNLTDNFERIIDILTYRKLYVPKLSSVNDPFEGGVIEYDVPGWAGKTMNKQAKKEVLINPYPIKNRLVLSLSASPLVEQLWAYYCNNYQGVCIVLKNGVQFKNAKYVKYYKERINVGMIHDNSFDTFIQELNDVNIYYKKREWCHEKEVRIEYKQNDLDNNFIDCGNLLVALIIGHNTQKIIKEKLIKVCKDNGIETYYTYLDENDLKIMIIPSEFKYIYDGSSIEEQLEDYYEKHNSILNYNGELRQPM
ncbi:MAG: hypothetical protein ACI4D4_01005 [Lachnospira sp.]